VGEKIKSGFNPSDEPALKQDERRERERERGGRKRERHGFGIVGDSVLDTDISG